MSDPTRDDMLAFLAGYYADEFDQEEAIYWFANDWHGGQWSNLYAALCASPFKPGPISSGPEADGMGALLYRELETKFAAD